MPDFTIDDFEEFDSLYRLVIVASRRANQLGKLESHGFTGITKLRKPTIMALEEVLEGKLGFASTDEEEIFE